ncbi:MAG: hypothetical protein ACLUVC_02200 [Longibaculum sp.]
MLDKEWLAQQLTVYESCGHVNYEKGCCDLLVSDYFDDIMDNQVIELYNDYLKENDYEEYHIFDDYFFNTFFGNPCNAARAVFFGNIKSWSDEYIRFDDYGNLKSFSDLDVLNRAKDDDDFKIWVLENYFEDYLREGYKNDVLKLTYDLLKEGY